MSILPRGAARWLILALVGVLSIAPIAPHAVFAQTDHTIGETATIANSDELPVLLRVAPNYDAEVLTVLPEGATVTVLDDPVTADDGSLWLRIQVEADDETGYVVADFLIPDADEVTVTAEEAPVNAEPDPEPEPVERVEQPEETTEVEPLVVAATGGTGTATTTANLNLRSGPNLSNAVITVIPSGSTVSVDGNAQGGFYPVTYNGTSGWAHGDYLRLGGGDGSSDGSDPGIGSARVRINLNLRAGPSTADDILRVMPAGATVTLTGQSANGFLSVSYNGQAGWAYADYLDTDGSAPAPSPEPDPDPSPVTGTARVTVNLNLRTGPSLGDSVVTVMPAGSTVTLTGNSSNGFLSVTYNGQTGWAFADYLDTGGSSSPPPPSEPDGRTAVTTANLNMRSGPSLSNGVILVIPAGSTVETTGNTQSGFHPVNYAGRSGWAHGDYLNFGGGSGNNPSPPPGGGGGIIWPVSGGSWRISQGYNGPSHYNSGAHYQYYYSFDLARVDGNTAGQAVRSPVNGTIRWLDPGSGGMAIDMGNGYAFAFFHATVASGLRAGQSVSQGQYLGTISGPGGPGFVQFPHLHITVWQTTDGGNWSRVAVPFSGANAISGQSFPDIGGRNQHRGTVFYP